MEGLADDRSWAAFGVVVAAEFGVGLPGGQDVPGRGEDGSLDCDEGALVAVSRVRLSGRAVM